ncbi:hypothetical protein PHISCL_07747 [Aspergillus sclerotialis]|uniref:DUF1770-domain-containing protein n=1 Tax=Aspergillus sclerotialis TaxID=2070753 RepID=A0A3A2ZS93_9EURO|nr:hypothetical protein PHISCL_07747 [Aspergillus sclerotialis]
MSDPIIQVSETIQTASVKQNPSPSRDISPPTSTSGKHLAVESSPDDAHSIPSDIVDPNRMIKPVTRRHNLPPLPDLRFEQSYLASLKGAESWGRIAWITIRDQVLLPFVQGTLWTLALSGWRYWNRNASLSGHTLGSRIRRWWYEVNNWKVPPRLTKDPRVAAQVEEFYTSEFSNAGAD